MAKNVEQYKGMKQCFESYMNQWVAVWCVRYTYRGIVKEACDEYVVLTDPRAVEISGSATAEKTNQEDKIPSDLVIHFESIEIVCQPTWVDKP